MKIHLDIETRSRADLPSVGAYRYGADPTTQVFMAAVSEGAHDAPVYLWINPLFRDAGVKSDPEALELLAQATEVRAFNVPFEQSVLLGTAFNPVIRLELYRCTQAMARIAGMPDSLDKCGEALGIANRKNAQGKTLIRHFSIPRKEDGLWNQPWDYRDKWATFAEYCRQDVRAEKEIHRLLRPKFDLSGHNYETFQFTMRMNALGIPVNVSALRNAQIIIDEVQSGAVIDFRNLTGINITQRAKVLAWLQDRGLPIDNMQAETLQSLDLSTMTPEVARVVTRYIELSYAAVKKVTSMLDWVMPDGRMRGVFKFYGAGTGRWSAGGPQIQNVKKPTPAMRPMTKDAYKYIAGGGTAEGISAVYGEPLEVIASCIRHFIQPPEGELLDADYNAIEARIICWLAKQDDILAMWGNGRDIYKWMAARIYNIGEKKITPDQRDMGKRAILGCGYGMGPDKFLVTCEAFGAPCDIGLAQRAVSMYRDMHPEVVAYWRKLNSNAFKAIKQPGTRFGEFIVENAAGRAYLFCSLPSGRRLAYPDPQIEDDVNFGEQITYWGQISMSQKWGRVKLYGGKLAENIDQATAADLMSHGARRAEASGMPPFALIHDQALAIHAGRLSSEFAAALTDLPAWAKGFPLKVEAKVAPFYTK